MKPSARALRQQHREVLDAYKRAVGCIDCGSREDLQFDHRDKSTKRFKIGANVAYGWETIWREVVKCDVRCGSCHAKRHHREEPGARSRRGIPNGARKREPIGGAGGLGEVAVGNSDQLPRDAVGGLTRLSRARAETARLTR